MSAVSVEDDGPVRHVVMSRPQKRNAINDEMIAGLHEALSIAAHDDSVRCVVVRGEGPMFSSGMDFAVLGGLAAQPQRLRELRSAALATWNLCEEMVKPTIAEIHGGCIGGAMELALACDLRVIAADAMIGLVETRVGLVPDVGGCSRLPSVIGLGRAKEMVMTGQLIDGTEAHRIGLVNRVSSTERLREVTNQLLSELLACAPIAVGLAKRLLDSAAKPALALTLEQEVSAQQICASSEDFAEGAAAFAQKRLPAFTGR